MTKTKYTLRVALNGTGCNPFHVWGLTCNPFPQLGRYEWDKSERIVHELGGDPIPDTAYIRRKLVSFNPEFVDRCCAEFRKGEYVKFSVSWEE